MAYLPPDDLRALEQTRQRLTQLSASLGSLRQSLETLHPLPDWDSLQTTTSLLYHNLRALQTTLSNQQNSAALAASHVYPTAQFPGQTQEGLLMQLLRKKLEPGVEDWVEEGRMRAAKMEGKHEEGGVLGEEDGEKRRVVEMREVLELWDWAAPHANDVAKKVLMADGDESEEAESDEDDDDDDGDGGKGADKMEGVESGEKGKAREPQAEPISLNRLLKFASTGQGF